MNTGSRFEDYADDAGYSGNGGMAGFLDDFIDVVNPLNSTQNALTLVTDPNALVQQGGATPGGSTGFSTGDQQQIAPLPSGVPFPSWAGSPGTFAGRITKLNAVMGTGFATDTFPLDPQLMAVVRQFQSSAGLVADGEMGAKTEAGLNARLGGNVAPVTPPSQPLAVVPSPPAAPSTPQGVTPAAATDASGDKTKLFIGLGIGAVLLLGLGYVALSD